MDPPKHLGLKECHHKKGHSPCAYAYIRKLQGADKTLRALYFRRDGPPGDASRGLKKSFRFLKRAESRQIAAICRKQYAESRHVQDLTRWGPKAQRISESNTTRHHQLNAFATFSSLSPKSYFHLIIPNSNTKFKVKQIEKNHLDFICQI